MGASGMTLCWTSLQYLKADQHCQSKYYMLLQEDEDVVLVADIGMCWP